eukprot:COSAG01_NODE_22549_length_849_cov_39.557923_1_plen_30_part_10
MQRAVITRIVLYYMVSHMLGAGAVCAPGPY